MCFSLKIRDVIEKSWCNVSVPMLGACSNLCPTLTYFATILLLYLKFFNRWCFTTSTELTFSTLYVSCTLQ